MLRLIGALAANLLYPLRLLGWTVQRRRARPSAVRLHLARHPPVAHAGWGWRRGPSLADLQDLLAGAAGDPYVSGLFVSVEQLGGGGVDYWELRGLLGRFRDSGKPVHVHVEHPDWRALMSTAPADRIVIHPAISVMVHGFGIELPFVGKLLADHGVELQVAQAGEYKGAMEPFARQEPSAPLQESLQALVDSLFAEASRYLTRRREAPDSARAEGALASGPFTSAQALERGLVDAIGEVDEAESALAAATGSPDRTRKAAGSVPARARPPDKGAPLAPHLQRLPPLRRSAVVRPRPAPWRPGPAVAFVPVDGLIVDRPTGGVPRMNMASASKIGPRIRALADARRVAAIVIVIDSRGGTASASDRLWAAIRYALAKKPVVAWLRGYAASGGYYVAAAAERIIASPFTITGSIGVVSAKPNVAAAAARWSVNPVLIGRGEGAGLMSPFRPFDAHELRWIEASIQESYARFRSVVAEGRRMSVEAVEAVARGRVWSGAQALELGLVDALGDYPAVIETVHELTAVPRTQRFETIWAAPPQGIRLLSRLLQRRAWLAGAHPLAAVDECLSLLAESPVLYYQPPVLPSL